MQAASGEFHSPFGDRHCPLEEAQKATAVLECSMAEWGQRVATLEHELQTLEERAVVHAATKPPRPELNLISSAAVLELEVLDKVIEEDGDAGAVLSALLREVPNKPAKEFETQELIDAARRGLSPATPSSHTTVHIDTEYNPDFSNMANAEQEANDALLQANTLRAKWLACPQPRTQDVHAEYAKWVEAGEKLPDWDDAAEHVLKTSQGCMTDVGAMQFIASKHQVELEGIRGALAACESEALHHPFNPDCEACRSQPVRKQIEGLREREGHLTTVLQGIQDKIVTMLRKGLRAKDNGGLKPPKGVKSATTDVLLEVHRTRIKNARALIEWSARQEFWREELDALEQYEAVKTSVEAAEKLWDERRKVVEEMRWRKAMAELAVAEGVLKERTTWEANVRDAEEAVRRYKGALERRDLITQNMGLLEAWDVWSSEHTALSTGVDGKAQALQGARQCADDARAQYRVGLEREDLVRRLLPDIEKFKKEDALWKAWKPWKHLMDALHLLYLQGEEARLLQVRRMLELRRALDVWLPAKREWTEVRAELDRVRKELMEMHRMQGAAEAQRRAADAVESAAASICSYSSMLQDRLVLLQHLDGCMGSFRGWLYQHYVGPLLESEVNSVLELLQAGDNRRIRLVARWKAHQEVFGWYLKDEQCATEMPLAKAGGFQRASVSLGMRIALARLGGSGVTSKHLFIDEGFVACDAENLARVPEFLRGLLGSYDTILLVSHVETIKESADVWIPIKRLSFGKSVLSRVQYGQCPRPATKWI
jgi:hypothetical protein